MNADQLSTVAHLATRLQSAGMIHVANMRERRASDDDLEVVSREAEAILRLAEQLAFAVGRLQTSIASEVRRPRLTHYSLGRAKPEAERLELSGMLADSEGGTHD